MCAMAGIEGCAMARIWGNAMEQILREAHPDFRQSLICEIETWQSDEQSVFSVGFLHYFYIVVPGVFRVLREWSAPKRGGTCKGCNNVLHYLAVPRIDASGMEATKGLTEIVDGMKRVDVWEFARERFYGYG